MLHAQCLSRGYNFASYMFLFGGGVTVAQQILVLLVLVRIQAPELIWHRLFSLPFFPVSSANPPRHCAYRKNLYAEPSPRRNPIK